MTRHATNPPLPDPKVFAALGDETRLKLIERLHREPELSISALAANTALTRQAVTKHLNVLAEAGLVRDVRRGRERLWRIDGAPLREVAGWVETYREHWEERLDRLDGYLRELQSQEEP